MASVVTITNLGEFPVAFMTFLGRFRNLGQILRDLRDLRDHSSVVSVVTAPNSIEFSVSTVSSVMTSSNLVEFSVASAALLVFSMSSVSSAALLGGFRGLRDDLRTWVNFL